MPFFHSTGDAAEAAMSGFVFVCPEEQDMHIHEIIHSLKGHTVNDLHQETQKNISFIFYKWYEYVNAVVECTASVKW